MIGLDGVELSYADRLVADGELPNLVRLRDRSASFLLDNPPERRTGLEWEQLTAALDAWGEAAVRMPVDGGRPLLPVPTPAA